MYIILTTPKHANYLISEHESATTMADVIHHRHNARAPKVVSLSLGRGELSYVSFIVLIFTLLRKPLDWLKQVDFQKIICFLGERF